MLNLSPEDIDFLFEHKLEELSEEQIVLLTENRIDFIKNANKDKISTDHDPESASMNSDKIVDHIASKIDPTSRKEHTQWLVNRYKAGDFKLSDSRDIKKTLSKFDEGKQHLEKKDLNSVKSISELKDHVAVVGKKIDLSKSEKIENTPKEMEQIFNEGGAVGYKVPSRATSIHNYGPNGKLAKTTWCTAAEGSRNMFTGYGGGKYTLHLPNDGGVMQIHHQSNQLMDEKDVPVNLRSPKYAPHADTIRKFIHTTHALEGAPESQLVKNNPLTLSDAELHSKIDSYHADLEKATTEYKNYIPYHITNALTTKANHIIESTKTGTLSDEVFNKLQKFPVLNNNDKVEYKDYSIAHSASLDAKPEHLSRMVDHVIGQHDAGLERLTTTSYQLSDVARNQNTPADAIHKIIGHAIKHSDHELADSVAKSAYLNRDHVNRLASKFDVSKNLIKNTNADVSDEHFDNVSKSGDTNALISMGEHPNVPDHVVPKILDSIGGTYNARDVIKNPKISKETIISHYENKVNKGTLVDVPVDEILKRDDVHGPDVDRLVNLGLHKNTKISNYWYRNNKLGKQHIQQVMDAQARLGDYQNIMSAPKIKSEDIDTLINHKGFDVNNFSHVKSVVGSHALKAKNIDTLLNKGTTESVARGLLDPDHSPNVLNHTHFDKLLASNEIGVHRKHQILHNPNVQLSHFNTLKDDISMHGAISSSKHAPPSILHSLATSPLDHVRLNVAKNPNTEERTHRILAGDAVSEIANIASKKVKK